MEIFVFSCFTANIARCLFLWSAEVAKRTNYLFAPVIENAVVGNSCKIQSQNELINHRCVELQHTLSVSGFRTYIMKGQGNAALYYSDLCYLRQCGDIDIYLEGGYDKVMEYVNTTFPTREVNELEIHYHCFNDVDVEIHYKPFIFDGPKDKILQGFLKSVLKQILQIELPFQELMNK